MASRGTGRVFSSGDANTRFVSVPADVAVDSAFPFQDGQSVEVRIDDDKLVIEEVE